MIVRYFANEKGYHIEGADGLRVTLSGPGTQKQFVTMVYSEIQNHWPGAKVRFAPSLKLKLDDHLKSRANKWK